MRLPPFARTRKNMQREATRLEYAPEFHKSRFAIGDVLEHLIAENEIKVIVWEGEFVFWWMKLGKTFCDFRPWRVGLFIVVPSFRTPKLVNVDTICIQPVRVHKITNAMADAAPEIEDFVRGIWAVQ